MKKTIAIVGHGGSGISEAYMRVARAALESKISDIVIVDTSKIEEPKEFSALPITPHFELQPMDINYQKERFYNTNPRSKKRKRPKPR